MYSLKFSEKNQRYQFYRKKWKIPDNDLPVVIKQIYKCLRYIIFMFQEYKKIYKEKEGIFKLFLCFHLIFCL